MAWLLVDNSNTRTKFALGDAAGLLPFRDWLPTPEIHPESLKAKLAGLDFDYAGVTQVGPRAETAPSSTSYAVSEYDPRSGRAVISADDIGLIAVGSIVTVSPGVTAVARDIEVVVSDSERYVAAWCGASTSGTRLANMLRSIARDVDSERVWGVYPYRVVRMSGDRVELQSSSQTAGLPDLLPIDAWYGAPGTRATLALGSDVLVGFVAGDRRRPYVQSYVGSTAPVSLDIGGTGGPAAARTGDSVRVTMPVGTFEGKIGGVDSTGSVTWLDPNAYGEVTSGSEIVRIA